MPDWLQEMLSPEQRDALIELERLALHFNEHLNLYSESSTTDFAQRHLLHSLSLASHPFPADAHVVDWGTGGGMPGLPMAIAFPCTTFHLVDAVGKKIQAVEAISRRLHLKNVQTYHCRAEQWEGTAHYSVSRATSSLLTLWTWHQRIASPLNPLPECWTPGLLCLKGRDQKDEVEGLTAAYPHLVIKHHPLLPLLEDAHFEGKEITKVYPFLKQ